MPNLIVFLDDGGVVNDNNLRGPQWQRLVGEFFPPILGGTPEAWSEANRIAAPGLWTQEYMAAAWERVGDDDVAFRRAYDLDWLTGMCEWVGVPVPSEKEALALARRASDYVTPRIRSAFPGAIEAIRTLHARGYRLYTSSGETSVDLYNYLEGMGVRACFERLYGTDLVNCRKEGAEFYPRIFAHAGINPNQALVVDDNPAALHRAAQAGARTVLVGAADSTDASDLAIKSLADLPELLP